MRRKAFLILLALSLAGCAAFAANPGDEAPPPAPEAPPVGVEVGNTGPELTLPNLMGDLVSLSDYRGQPVMINFWAVWCGFCRTELPEMQSAYEEHKDSGFVILAIDVMEDPESVGAFAEELGLTFPILLDRKGEVSRSYRVRGLPTSYFVDQNGVIIGKQLGPIDREWIERYLARAGVE